MESENCKDTITSPQEIKPPKNPKRVEQGKKLAQWSREAKQKKNTSPQRSYFGYICAGVIVTLAGVGYYFKDNIKNIKNIASSKLKPQPQPISLEQPEVKDTPTKRFSLD